MPRLWTETIESHRREVHDAVISAAVELVAERGVRGVTMSDVAEAAGIGRATLYKYFGDVESILFAWHARQVEAHLAQLLAARENGVDPMDRLANVLRKYAELVQQSHTNVDTDLIRLLHREADASPEDRLRTIVEALVEDAAKTGTVRTDASAAELASYCIHALGAARGLASTAAIRRLVTVTISGLRRH